MDNDAGMRYGHTTGKRLFLSYAREDRDALRPLEEGIEVLHHELWVDRKLEAGHAWWKDITDRIRECDAMLIAVSPALLESEAAASERRYARELNKPLIPVVIAPVTDDFLPSDIAGLQFVDFAGDPRAPFHLANVLASLPPTPPLPQPLPEPPPVPTSYMAGLADKIREPMLSFEDQMALVGSLRASLDQPKERDTARRLLRQLQERRDLYNRPGKEIDALLSAERPPDRAPAGGGPDGAVGPRSDRPSPQAHGASAFPGAGPVDGGVTGTAARDARVAQASPVRSSADPQAERQPLGYPPHGGRPQAYPQHRPPGYQPPGYGTGYGPDPAQGQKHKTTALVLGIVGLLVLGIVFGPLAIWQAGKAERHGVKATEGKVLGWVDIVGGIFIMLAFLGGA